MTRGEKWKNTLPSDIKEKSVAYVKITHEPVFVLKIEGDIAHCRRGVMAQSGNYYTETDFTLGELVAEDPNRMGFESIFKQSEGEISVTSNDSSIDSLLQ